jgi:hypothetical protein
MTVDRKRLRELALAATPGPWNTPTGDYVWAGETQIAARDEERDFAQASVDMHFIAEANPQTILAMLDALDAAEQPAPDDARNAKRFRWLCDASGQEWEALAPYQLVGQLDAAIDAAIQAQERTP